MIYTPEPYQLEGTLELLRHRRFGLLFDPGLGKTATVLHAVKALSLARDPFRALVIAPRLVCIDTWPQEIDKWDQFRDLGHVQLRDEKEIDFDRPEKLWLINPELPRLAKLFGALVQWISERKGLPFRGLDYWLTSSHQQKRFEAVIKADPSAWPFRMLVNDESSKFKNPSAKRFKLLRKFLPFFRHRVILTGTFAPNGIQDVFSQQFIMDLGATLGKGVTSFRDKYFQIDNPKYYTYKPLPDSAEAIQKLIAPWVMRLDAAEHLDLPELVHNRIDVSLPKKAKSVYEDIEQDFFAELDEDKTLIVQSSSAKYMLCRQMANGSYYDPKRDKGSIVAERLHGSKTERLKNLIDELQGKPLLVAYYYRSDALQIQKDLKQKLPVIGGQTTERQARAHLERWNRRELPVLLAQCSSISHGLNMQSGGNDLCFYSLTDNLEDYEQLIRRIYRRGVTGQVRVHYLIAKGTIDVAVYRRIKNKEKSERSLLKAIENYRKEK